MQAIGAVPESTVIPQRDGSSLPIDEPDRDAGEMAASRREGIDTNRYLHYATIQGQSSGFPVLVSLSEGGKRR